MNKLIIEIIAGIGIASIYAYLVHRIIPDKAPAFWRTGLVVAALIYVAFAIIGSRPDALPLEILGLAIYSVFALLSKKYTLHWLALGWGLHVLWDILLHSHEHTSYVPHWYPGVCLGFDIVIAVYILVLIRKRKLVLS